MLSGVFVHEDLARHVCRSVEYARVATAPVAQLRGEHRGTALGASA